MLFYMEVLDSFEQFKNNILNESFTSLKYITFYLTKNNDNDNELKVDEISDIEDIGNNIKVTKL